MSSRSEAQHRRIAALRPHAEGLFAFLAEARVPFCVNHLFSALTGSRRLRDIHVARVWLLWATHLGAAGSGSRRGCCCSAGGPCRRVLAASALAAGGANACIICLKRRFRRARPAPHVPSPRFDLAFDRFSFPSGHATNPGGVHGPPRHRPLRRDSLSLAGTPRLRRVLLSS